MSQLNREAIYEVLDRFGITTISRDISNDPTDVVFFISDDNYARTDMPKLTEELRVAVPHVKIVVATNRKAYPEIPI
jgi:hypothetical protein